MGLQRQNRCSPTRVVSAAWAIFKMILLLILSNDATPQSLVQALRAGVVFLNRKAERHVLQVSLALQLLDQCASDALVLICR